MPQVFKSSQANPPRRKLAGESGGRGGIPTQVRHLRRVIYLGQDNMRTAINQAAADASDVVGSGDISQASRPVSPAD